ncbi:hypothetical protein BFW01_g11703 [Lasiodiplodia theobromae]|nr:hypothetical protein BFW01_g11703 [Lasiodiplodia theobromae]
MYLACKNTQLSDEVEKLHKQYGDFVRIGPREISVNRPAAVQLVHGPPSSCKKSPWYAQVTNDVTKCSLNSVRVSEVHRQRRRAWDRSLGVKALAKYEPRVKAKTDTLISQIRKLENSPVDATDWSMFFSFDVMGEVGLGKDLETLKSGKTHPTIKGIHDSMSIIGLLTPVPWLLTMLAAIPGAASKLTAFMNYCAGQVKDKQMEVDKDADPQDILSYLIKARFENDKSAPPGEGALHEDARLLIIAGRSVMAINILWHLLTITSDTTANALSNTLNFFARNPRVLKKLQGLLDEYFPNGDSDWSYEKVKQISYLDDIINESLRLRPPVPSGLGRLTPPEGLQIDEVYIPGDTIVSIPAQTLHRDPRNYENPLDFVPERWSDGKLNPETAPFITFSRGAMNCAGKQLAKLELRMFLSRVALNFDISYAPGETGEYFEKNQQDTFTLTLPPLPLMFKSRNA